MAGRASKRTGRPSDSGKDAGDSPDGARVGVRHGERDAPVVSGGGISAFLYDADGDDRDVAPDAGLLTSSPTKTCCGWMWTRLRGAP